MRAGMIVPYVVAYSMMWGAIVSWGIMWPLISRREGDWYPAGIQDGDFRGLSGYKVGIFCTCPCMHVMAAVCILGPLVPLRPGAATQVYTVHDQLQELHHL